MMKTLRTARALGWLAILAAAAQASYSAVRTNWVAYNDHRPTEGVTHPNATGYDMRVTGDGGALKDFATGASLPVTLEVTSTGTTAPDDFGANNYPDPGTPAFAVFDGAVDIGNSGTIGVRSSAGSTVLLTFKNLDPSQRYTVKGSSIRGGNYADRWAVYTISGAVASTAAHETIAADTNLFTKATFPSSTLTASQVALNAGHNTDGSLVVWKDVDPGADGEFSILAEHYTGPTPFGNAAAGPYGYGFTAVYLAEVGEILPIAITTHPASITVAPGASANFSVGTSGTGISFQWQKAAPGSATFTDISGATQATLALGAVSLGDDGSQYRVIVTGQGNTLTSRSAALSVQGAPIEIAGMLRMDIFKNITGTSIAELEADPEYPASPDEVVYLTGFDTRTALPTDALNNYGAVISGFIIPRETGSYDFMLRSDDASQLFISADQTEANLALVAEEFTCCGAFEEPGATETTQTPLTLQAGQKYAVKALLKEGGGGDFLQVAWRKTGDQTAAASLLPISPAFLSVMAPAQGTITITRQPESVSSPQNSTIALSVEAATARSPLLVQWQKNEVTIPGLVGSTVQYGPLAPSDNNAKFRAVLSVPGAVATSAEATVTVTTDTTPPSVVSAVASEAFNSLLVTFSEAVTAASAGNAANYTVDQGLTVTGAQVLSPTRVRLTTSVQAPATTYTLTIRNIVDTAGVASAANSSATFSSFAIMKGGLKFEAWTGITGTPVPNLTDSPRYLEPADVVGYLTAANTRTIWPDDSHDNYGARLSAWLVPTESGDYDFMIRSDDASQLWLSTDDTEANLQMIAEETGCCGAFEEPGFAETTVSPISLVAGRRYYFQVLYKEGGGGDYAQVAWRKAGDATPANTLQPMPGSLFEIVAMPGTLTPPGITFDSPAPGSVIPEGSPVVLNVTPTVAPGKTVSRVEIFRGSTRIADLSAGPFTTSVTGLTPDVYTFTARVTDSAGLYTTTPALSVSVGEAREVRNLVMIDDNTTWRFNREGVDQGTEWQLSSFNDTGWQSGKALIADESGGTVEPIRTPISRLNDLGEYVKTMYFRTKFNWTGSTNNVKLSLRHVIDDGAVVYLNGVEVHRFGITAGVPVTYDTDAASHEQAYAGPFDVPANLLREGENLLAVEVHQNGGSSSDIVFGAELTASVPVGGGPTPTPQFTRVELAGGNLRLEWTGGGTLQSRTTLDLGNWADVPGAASPHTTPPDGRMKFFRIRR